jgi:enoyl-CoA hydratase
VIGHLVLTPQEYDAFVTAPFVDERIVGDGVTTLIVRGGAESITPPGSLPVVVLWVGSCFGGDGPEDADAVIGEADVDATLAVVEHAPIAAATLVTLLRVMPAVDVEGGLALESAAYSTLQAGPEFAAWRAAAAHAPGTDDGPVVLTERHDATLVITLDRPHRRNAIDARLRDQLAAALELALVDDSIELVELCGNGPSFCSGGDLGEFGSRADPATAHVIRLARSPGRLVHRLRDRLTVHVHGATYGGGIETAAFAGRVVAHVDTSIALPEITLGLIPGAGGTVSLTRRIGRQRTAALALTGRPIDASTALAWGLVDVIDERPVPGSSAD